MTGLDVPSRNAAWCWKQVRLTRHTALLTLKPEPNASCHTLSPLLTPCLVSMYANTYLQGGSRPDWGLSCHSSSAQYCKATSATLLEARRR